MLNVDAPTLQLRKCLLHPLDWRVHFLLHHHPVASQRGGASLQVLDGPVDVGRCGRDVIYGLKKERKKKQKKRNTEHRASEDWPIFLPPDVPPSVGGANEEAGGCELVPGRCRVLLPLGAWWCRAACCEAGLGALPPLSASAPVRRRVMRKVCRKESRAARLQGCKCSCMHESQHTNETLGLSSFTHRQLTCS